jgi:hypothetical protein
MLMNEAENYSVTFNHLWVEEEKRKKILLSKDGI